MQEKEGSKHEKCRVYALRKQKILIDVTGNTPQIPGCRVAGHFGIKCQDAFPIGVRDQSKCLAFSIPEDAPEPEGMEFIGIRKAFGILDKIDYVLAVKALGILNWDRTCRFCGVCGSKLTGHTAILAKNCTSCGSTIFPKISPAVIVLVEKGEKVLLGRASRFHGNLYSVLAGFAEPGESLEDVVRREVMEEVGIEVKDVRYFGSQPWPYPDSLMIGFTASWAGGEISVDNDEISDARWFSVHELPNIPDKISIARSLIDWFIEKNSRR
jgi:NAD+ diphosphatase